MGRITAVLKLQTYGRLILDYHLRKFSSGFLDFLFGTFYIGFFFPYFKGSGLLLKSDGIISGQHLTC